MGGIHKEIRITGKSLSSAFLSLQKSDREDYGSDYYSGGWNNAQGVIEVSKNKFNSDDPGKHDPAWALCVKKPVGNNMKVKTKVTNYPARGTRKWITRYEVEHPVHGNVLISESKQADAISKARSLVEKNPEWDLSVHITKKLTTSSRVADIEYKESSKEADGVWDIKGVLPY